MTDTKTYELIKPKRN